MEPPLPKKTYYKKAKEENNCQYYLLLDLPLLHRPKKLPAIIITKIGFSNPDANETAIFLQAIHMSIKMISYEKRIFIVRKKIVCLKNVMNFFFFVSKPSSAQNRF